MSCRSTRCERARRPRARGRTPSGAPAHGCRAALVWPARARATRDTPWQVTCHGSKGVTPRCGRAQTPITSSWRISGTVMVDSTGRPPTQCGNQVARGGVGHDHGPPSLDGAWRAAAVARAVTRPGAGPGPVDRDLVTVGELGHERHHAAVDPAGGAPVTRQLVAIFMVTQRSSPIRKPAWVEDLGQLQERPAILERGSGLRAVGPAFGGSPPPLRHEAFEELLSSGPSRIGRRP